MVMRVTGSTGAEASWNVPRQAALRRAYSRRARARARASAPSAPAPRAAAGGRARRPGARRRRRVHVQRLAVERGPVAMDAAVAMGLGAKAPRSNATSRGRARRRRTGERGAAGLRGFGGTWMPSPRGVFPHRPCPYNPRGGRVAGTDRRDPRQRETYMDRRSPTKSRRPEPSRRRGRRPARSTEPRACAPGLGRRRRAAPWKQPGKYLAYEDGGRRVVVARRARVDPDRTLAGRRRALRRRDRVAPPCADRLPGGRRARARRPLAQRRLRQRPSASSGRR